MIKVVPLWAIIITPPWKKNDYEFDCGDDEME